MPFIQCQQVRRIYPTGQGVKLLSFNLEKTEKVALLGLNGSGKTTTLRMLAGLIHLDKGQILIDGLTPRLARDKIAFLSDRPGFYPWMKTADVERFMESFFPDFHKIRFKELCKTLKVPDHQVRQMSKGELQRLGLAATFARNAEFYLLDEPLSGIDIVSRQAILAVLSSYQNPKACMLISTHEIQEIEGFLDRVIILRSGELILDQQVDEICRVSGSVSQRFIELNP